jgi:hypothetical protein
VSSILRHRNALEFPCVYPTALIVGAALLEGPTFLLSIAYFLEGLVLDLVAAGVLLGALAARYPTRARVVGWLERQLALIAREPVLEHRPDEFRMILDHAGGQPFSVHLRGVFSYSSRGAENPERNGLPKS